MPYTQGSALSQRHLPDTKISLQPLPIAGPTGLILNIQQASCLVSVSVSWDCYNKVPQTGCLKTTEIYSLKIVEARILKSDVVRAIFLLKTVRKSLSLPLPSSDGCQQSLLLLDF